MIGIDRLMQRSGVVAAGQFSPDGKVLRSSGELDKDEMERVARLCVAHQSEATETITELNRRTPLDWSGLNGWVLWGGKYALCVSGDTGVFVEASKADFNQILVDLFGPPAAGKRVD